MSRITFTCQEIIALPPEELSANILNMSKWAEFEGYGMMPGIASAEFEIRTPETTGTRIRVTNTDGSSHVEEVVIWEPDRCVVLHMNGFSPPLSRLAERFVEKWEYEHALGGTRVIRSFELHAKSVFSRPALWCISWLLKKAIARQLQQMRDEATGGAP